jgi:hypothetical protein
MVTMSSTDNDALGVMFRYQDNDNYYRFSWDRERRYRRLVKKEKGEFVVLAEDKESYVIGQTYDVEILADGTTLEIWIDGELVFSAEDGSLSEGSIALYSWANEGSYFDDIYVEDLATGNVLLSEDFNEGDLSDWAIVDEGADHGPSAWSAEMGILSQDSNIHSPPTDARDPAKLGTFAFYGVPGDNDPPVQPATTWTDYRVRVTMSSTDNDALGVMFRYQDNDNYYRFSWDRERRYRRLVKKEDGEFVVLAKDKESYVVGQTYDVEIVADGTTLEIWIDGELVLSAEDGSLSEGTIALYSWANEGSYFDDIYVEDLATGNVLLSEDFNEGDLSDWAIVDEGTNEGPSAWSAEMGILLQDSNIHSPPRNARDPAKLGTFAFYGVPEGNEPPGQRATTWTDYRVRVTMSSTDNDALGVMFRYQDNDNYYRFSWDSSRRYRRLVKKENGQFVVLAEDKESYVIGQTYDVEIVADGTTLEIWIDGELVLCAEDGSLAEGTIALYSWGNEGSYLDDICVEDLATGNVLLSEDFNEGDLSDWTIVDEGADHGPSAWSAEMGILLQYSNIHSSPRDASDPAKLGTFAFYYAG